MAAIAVGQSFYRLRGGLHCIFGFSQGMLRGAGGSISTHVPNCQPTCEHPCLVASRQCKHGSRFRFELHTTDMRTDTHAELRNFPFSTEVLLQEYSYVDYYYYR
jgi:hypothetical protein